MEGVFDLPMGAHGLGGLLGGERARGDVVSALSGAVIFVLDAGLDPDDGGDLWEAVFAGEAPASGHPVDCVGDVAAALLDPAVALVGHCHVNRIHNEIALNRQWSPFAFSMA